MQKLTLEEVQRPLRPMAELRNRGYALAGYNRVAFMPLTLPGVKTPDVHRPPHPGAPSPYFKVKLDKILELASKHQVSIIALQETKLNTRHRLRVKGYNIVRQDRSSNGGGGLVFLIRDVYFQGIYRINSPRKSLEKGAVPRGKHKKTRPAFTNDSQDLQKLLAKREHLLQSHNLNDNTDARIELNKINTEIKREKENKKTGRATRKLIRSCRVPENNELFNEPITSSELLYAIQQLDFKKSPGLDGIHGQFIVNLGSCATKRLLHIFNLSWKLGRLPRQWKTAIVVSIRKPNKDASCMGSYRPIALTCMTCKLMERIILRRITFHLMNRNMLPQEQYGFRKGHSTIDQILYFVQRVRDAHNMKPSRHTMAVFLDLTKAFDKVWKNKLLGKCFSEFNIKGRVLPWLSDFMKNRSFRVRYQNSLSEIFKTYQGIPQGSVLSPTLFSLYLTGIERDVSLVK
ncbi:probable RNA-directed DNA polymerase from transposon BS [Caerostris extrusa]|uniref:Probable RNA-directed DNA polymerase from transposon BS n=1 Tax=Caerostris extrusa TaxID=172846 RepID=A0AAV4NJG2_CAEEX|nr:probable RNA-directed DNA polymerase from transposon BS [Caerostris extrusa]